MNGFSKISIIGFLLLLLVGSVYFNDQVEFNSVQSKWELQEQYVQRELIPAEIETQQINYLDFDGVNDYVSITNDNIILDGDWEINLTLVFDNINKENYIFSFAYNESNSFLIYIDPNSSLNIAYANLNNGTFQSIDSNFSPNENQIYELKLKHFNGNQYEYYIDNTLIYTFTMSTPIFDSSNIHLGYAFPRNKAGSFFDGSIYYFNIIDDFTTVLEYNFNDGSGNILTDIAGNNDGIINGATWQSLTQNVIVTPTQSAIDSYQVFENIRNNASTVNPFGYMDTVLDIPSQMVGFTNRWFDFLGFDFRNDLIGDTPSEVMENTDKWYWNIFEWVIGVGN